MWQAETFDAKTIDQELSYAQGIGMNAMRVFLHHVAWQEDKKGFKKRIEQFLKICSRHHIKPMFVFFDDCWNDTYHKGKQPAPKLGIHNSQWLQDPGKLQYEDPMLMDTLKAYVEDILITFKHDKRVLLWDLYNEPGHNRHFDASFLLLQNAFAWAKAVNPDQPLSAGYWNDAPQLNAINQFLLASSDIITYHSYGTTQEHQQRIDKLKLYNRPMICTEYMARKRGSTFVAILPMLKTQHIGAINWGLVAGKTNTKYAWDEPMPGGGEPKLWFHDIFWPDGKPYDSIETKLIKYLTSQTKH